MYIYIGADSWLLNDILAQAVAPTPYQLRDR